MARGTTEQPGKSDDNTVLSFNEGKAKLTPEVLGVDVAVLTFQSLRRDAQTRIGPSDVITFAEYPDNWWYVNTTSLKRIAAKYGLDYSKWVGKPVVLFAHRGAVVGSGKPTTTFWAADPAQEKGDESWDALLKQAKKAAKKESK